MSKEAIVFYAGRLLLEFTSDKEFTVWRRSIVVGDAEFYNGGIVYRPNDKPAPRWYRMDSTPMLIEDVPPELRLQALLLT